MRWKSCGNNRLRRTDQKPSFGYDALEMGVKFHRRDIKWQLGVWSETRERFRLELKWWKIVFHRALESMRLDEGAKGASL